MQNRRKDIINENPHPHIFFGSTKIKGIWQYWWLHTIVESIALSTNFPSECSWPQFKTITKTVRLSIQQKKWQIFKCISSPVKSGLWIATVFFSKCFRGKCEGRHDEKKKSSSWNACLGSSLGRCQAELMKPNSTILPVAGPAHLILSQPMNGPERGSSLRWQPWRSGPPVWQFDGPVGWQGLWATWPLAVAPPVSLHFAAIKHRKGNQLNNDKIYCFTNHLVAKMT